MHPGQTLDYWSANLLEFLKDDTMDEREYQFMSHITNHGKSEVDRFIHDFLGNLGSGDEFSDEAFDEVFKIDKAKNIIN